MAEEEKKTALAPMAVHVENAEMTAVGQPKKNAAKMMEGQRAVVDDGRMTAAAIQAETSAKRANPKVFVRRFIVTF